MSGSTVLIADHDKDRGDKLCEWLGEFGVEGVEVDAAGSIDRGADMLFIAVDLPGSARPEVAIEQFARHAPKAPVVIATDAPFWQLITQAVRQRDWMDVPQTKQYHDLLSRYAISRSPRPKIIMESNLTRRTELMAQWQNAPNCPSELILAESLGEAFEIALGGRASALLNAALSSNGVTEPGISTLIYSLSPTVIAVMLEAWSRKSAQLGTIYTEPGSRFVLMKSSFGRNNIELLLKTMCVDWPSVSPP